MHPSAYEEMRQLEESHWWYRGMRRIAGGLLCAALERRQELCILDAGCGTGMNMQALQALGHVVGIDRSPLAIEHAASRNLQTLVQASVDALPFPDGHFDLVTSFDVLYAEQVPDDVAALRELARVTRPGGHLLIRVPALPALGGAHDRRVHGARRYVLPELRAKLLHAQLTPVRLTYANALLLPLIFAARRLRPAHTAASDVRPTPSLLNHLLLKVLEIEHRWVNRLQRDLPFGVSLLALARKPRRSCGAA